MFYGLVRDSAIIGTARYAYGKAKRGRKRGSKVPQSSAPKMPKGRTHRVEPHEWVED